MTGSHFLSQALLSWLYVMRQDTLYWMQDVLVLVVLVEVVLPVPVGDPGP